jgi:hypothetical protein
MKGCSVMEKEHLEVTKVEDRRKNKQNLIVTMTIQELDDYIYYGTYRAIKRIQNELFKGIEPFFVKMNDDLEIIVREQEYIKILLQSRNMSDYEGEH